jgi:molybdopterin-guanine dinucleotide biosynthesis protein A
VSPRLVVGIFVGGRGRRMGGVAKGLLRAPDSTQTLLERLGGELRLALPHAELVLVGRAEAYAASGLHVIADQPENVGPIGGLGGLLEHATDSHVLALACDLPRISAPLLARLASEQPDAAALVVETEGIKNPLIARYDAARVQPVLREVVRSGRRALQAVLEALGTDVKVLALSSAEEQTLGDWDTPEDIR